MNSLKYIVSFLHLCKISIKCFLVLLLCFPLLLSGCQKKEKLPKTGDIEFTVVAKEDIPDDLQTSIDERKAQNFELSYSDGSCLYAVKGYGEKPTGGYSVTVNDFFISDNVLVFDTNLSGPKDKSSVSAKPSYPYIVVKTEFTDKSIIFQ